MSNQKNEMDTRTLKEIWDIGNRNPTKVECNEKNFIGMLIGIYKDKAYLVPNNYPQEIYKYDNEVNIWRPYKDPEPVPHWPALRKPQDCNNTEYSITSTLYYCEEQAKNGLKNKFIRLLQETKPIMLIPTKWTKKY